MEKALVAIDIGNTTISIGVFVGEQLSVQKLDTMPFKSPPEYLEILRENVVDKGLKGVVISSVVPGLTPVMAKAGEGLSGRSPLIVGPGAETGLKFDVPVPEELGADRISACAGAVGRYPPPLAVLDFGTATTVNIVGRGNAYKGGAILPGLGLMRDVLHERTARLPRIEVPTAEKTVGVIGKDTAGAMLSGLLFGNAGAVERIISGAEEAEGEIYKVVVTGGYAEAVLPYLRRNYFFEPVLVLKGMKAIFERAYA